MNDDNEVRSILDVLSTVLEPLGTENRDKALGWIAEEIRTHAVVEYCQDEGSPVEQRTDPQTKETYIVGGPLEWRVSSPNPIDPAATVFAMFHWDVARCVAAFSFKRTEREGGQVATEFFRTLVTRPIHIHGPVHHFAMINEIDAFIGDGDGDAPDAETANSGATAQA